MIFPGEGFIGHDGRFYSRDEMEREYRQQLNREIDQRSDIARFHQESLIGKVLHELVDPKDQVAWANALLNGAYGLGLKPAIRRNDGKVFSVDSAGGHDRLVRAHGNGAPLEYGFMLDGRFISKEQFYELEKDHFTKHTPEDAPFRRNCPLCAAFSESLEESVDPEDLIAQDGGELVRAIRFRGKWHKAWYGRQSHNELAWRVIDELVKKGELTPAEAKSQLDRWGIGARSNTSDLQAGFLGRDGYYYTRDEIEKKAAATPNDSVRHFHVDAWAESLDENFPNFKNPYFKREAVKFQNGIYLDEKNPKPHPGAHGDILLQMSSNTELDDKLQDLLAQRVALLTSKGDGSRIPLRGFIGHDGSFYSANEMEDLMSRIMANGNPCERPIRNLRAAAASPTALFHQEGRGTNRSLGTKAEFV